jgi:hypothetical protein
MGDVGVRAAFQEDREFSPAEAVFGTQLVLPGQFANNAESPSPSFLEELFLHPGPGPGPLAPVYDGHYRVLERSTHFFLLQIG